MAVDNKYSIVFLKDKVTQHNYVFYYLTKLLVRFFCKIIQIVLGKQYLYPNKRGLNYSCP